jgi:3-phenylpropionate/trans-cinnamate dioxygenase ferredoxin reductase subunit
MQSGKKPRAVRYLVVGGGMTADAAVAGIRQQDAEGSVVVVGAEAYPPYQRPPLTKGLWGAAEESAIWLQTENVEGIELVLGRRIVTVDAGSHSAVDDRGESYSYEKLLLATGSTPRRLPNADGVVYFRTLDDYRHVRERALVGAPVIVVGGGFIGSEIAAALVGSGCDVTMVFPDSAIGQRLLPGELARFVNGYYRDRGVEVIHDETVVGADEGSVTLGSGRTIVADLVVAGIGVEPDVGLAVAAGLTVDNGIVVDEYGRAEGQADVFAAGDVANFPMIALGKRFRFEHEDHARTHGRTVGANMAGATIAYDHLPLFYSDMFDLGYEAVGEVDSRLASVEYWAEPNRKGVIAYVDGSKRPKGFLFWNTWDSVEIGRVLIRGQDPIDAARLALIFA